MAEKEKRDKRLLVTVSPSMYELVHELGKEASIATSQLIGEMIEEARPAFEAMLEAVKQAKAQQADAYDTLHRVLIGAQAQISEKQLDLLDHREQLRRARGSKQAEAASNEAGRDA